MKLTFILLLVSTITLAQDTLRIEFGTRVGTIHIVQPPNTVDGWGSCANGNYGTDLVFHLEEVNNSYSGSLVGSEWLSYGSMMSAQDYPYMQQGLGYYPDTLRYIFQSSSDLLIISSDSTGNSTTQTCTYSYFTGTGTMGIDSMDVSSDFGGSQLSHNIQVNAPPLSIDENGKNEVRFGVFPNPSNDVVYVYGLNEFKNSMQLVFYSVDGKEVKRESITSAAILISDLKNGVYLLKLLDEGRPIKSTTLIKR